MQYFVQSHIPIHFWSLLGSDVQSHSIQVHYRMMNLWYQICYFYAPLSPSNYLLYIKYHIVPLCESPCVNSWSDCWFWYFLESIGLSFLNSQLELFILPNNLWYHAPFIFLFWSNHLSDGLHFSLEIDISYLISVHCRVSLLFFVITNVIIIFGFCPIF